MAFRTQLNISDKRLIQTEPIKLDLNESIDPNSIVEVNSVLDLDFNFVSNSEETEFIFPEFSFKVDKFYFEPITSWNVNTTFQLGPHFYETATGIKGVKIEFFVDKIEQIENDTFKGNCFTNEYIEYTANLIADLEKTAIIKENGNSELPILPKETVTIKSYEINTEKITAEDNRIELNFGGNHHSALKGGFSIIDGVSDGIDSTIEIDDNGSWEFNPGILIPKYDNEKKNNGFISWDNEYLYLDTEEGTKKVKLEKL